MRIKIFILTLSVCFLSSIVGCTVSSKATSGNAISNDIPYRLAEKYFVKNTAVRVPDMILSEAEFKQYFGTAAVMGKSGQATAIDFSKEYVVAVTLPETEFSTAITPVAMKHNGVQKFEFHCNVEVGEKQSFTTRPVLLGVVSRQYLGDVKVVLTYTPSVLTAYYDGEISID